MYLLLIDLKMDVDEKRKVNEWYTYTVDCATAPPSSLFFLLSNAYMSAYHHFLVVFLFLVLMCVYRTTKHQVRRYIVLYIDGKNAYDAVCRIILKRYKPVRAQWVLSFASFCVGEKRREKKKNGIIRRKERERRRYMYIYKPSASLILVRRAQKATRQICVASPFVCVLKRFYSGK